MVHYIKTLFNTIHFYILTLRAYFNSRVDFVPRKYPGETYSGKPRTENSPDSSAPVIEGIGKEKLG